ncbi:MAG: FAD-dependent oxidoreductase, partial [Salinivenus sp.]
MTATSTPPARIVIIGGGTGGTVTANRLAEKLHSEIDAGEADITLVTDGPQHVYKPMWLYVAFNRKDVEESYRPHREVLDDRVNLAIDRVTDIEPDAHQIQTADRTEPIEYDRLVVATGATIEEPRIEGFDEHGQHFYTADGALELKERLAGFEGGELVLSTIGVPHMCPAAPVEFVLIADEWLSRRGLREDTEITYTYPIHAAHEVRTLADWIEPTFEARDIALETAFEVEAVDADTLY